MCLFYTYARGIYNLIYTPESDGSVRRDFLVADIKKGGRVMEAIAVPFIEQNYKGE